jgi:hypothetical protein
MERREQHQIGAGEVAGDRLRTAGDGDRKIAAEHRLDQNPAALDVEHLGVQPVLF